MFAITIHLKVSFKFVCHIYSAIMSVKSILNKVTVMKSPFTKSKDVFMIICTFEIVYTFEIVCTYHNPSDIYIMKSSNTECQFTATSSLPSQLELEEQWQLWRPFVLLHILLILGLYWLLCRILSKSSESDELARLLCLLLSQSLW